MRIEYGGCGKDEIYARESESGAPDFMFLLDAVQLLSKWGCPMSSLFFSQ